MEAVFLYLLFFFAPGEITVSYVLFWAIVICLIMALIFTRRSLPETKWMWGILFVLELIALVWGNIESKWSNSWESIDANLARIGVLFYTILTVISVVSFWRSLDKIRNL